MHNINVNAFEIGMAKGEVLTNVAVLDTEAGDPRISQHNVREYFAGIFAGLNMKLGRWQEQLDLHRELGEDDLADEADRQCRQLYTLVQQFAKQYMF